MGDLEVNVGPSGWTCLPGPVKLVQVEELADMSSDGYAALHLLKLSYARVAVHTQRTWTTMTLSTPLLFSTIEVTRQAFYRSPLSYAIVNLKPIVPGRESRSFPTSTARSTTVRCSGHPHACCTEADRPHNARVDVSYHFRPTRRSCD